MHTPPDHPGVSTLVGTPQEVQARLGKSQAERVLAVAFEHIPPPTFETLAENFANVASSMFEGKRQRISTCFP